VVFLSGGACHAPLGACVMQRYDSAARSCCRRFECWQFLAYLYVMPLKGLPVVPRKGLSVRHCGAVLVCALYLHGTSCSGCVCCTASGFAAVPVFLVCVQKILYSYYLLQRLLLVASASDRGKDFCSVDAGPCREVCHVLCRPCKEVCHELCRGSAMSFASLARRFAMSFAGGSAMCFAGHAGRFAGGMP
jgi:hypothetical protein